MKQLIKKGITILLALFIICSILPQSASASTATQKVLSLTFKVSEDFILGVTNATISFKLQLDAKSVKISIIDSVGKARMSWDVGALKAGDKKTITWDGKNTSGKLVAEDFYAVKVVADKATSTSDMLYAIKQVDFAGGNGSKSKPYLVSSSDQLYNVRKYPGKYFKQTKDIDFDYSDIDPLFSMDLPFKGTYDGGGFAIKNLAITRPNDTYVALFIAIDEKSKLSNVKLENVMITGGRYVAGLVAHNSGTIVTCSVDGVVSGSFNDNTSVGGIVAINYGNINSCKSSGIVSASSNDYQKNAYCGGIVAYNYGNVISCISSMNTSVSAPTKESYILLYNSCYAGGIVGCNKGIINKSTASGNVTSSGACYITYYYNFAGGIAGYNSNSIFECQYKGLEVKATDAKNAGEIVGYQQ